jgi:heme-degrading monooxygenase HmoA
MIIRVFRARVQPGMGATHERMVRDLSIPLVESQQGFITCYTGRPVGSNSDEYVMVSLWKDIDSLRVFAGENWEEGVIPKPERPNLKEIHVHHYEAFGKDG